MRLTIDKSPGMMRVCVHACACFLVVALLQAAGCSSGESAGGSETEPPSEGGSAPPSQDDLEDALGPTKGSGGLGEDLGARIVEVYYGTNRNRTESDRPYAMYGTSRRDSVEYGRCYVSIPRHHTKGELESPLWGWRSLESTKRHVVLIDVSPMNEAGFFSRVSARVRMSESKDAFVFVHGYNVTFEDAARRTAQISYDIGFDGAPIMFSWPSKGKGDPLSYAADWTTTEWAMPYVEQFLVDVAQRTDAENVHILVHSMGNRAVMWALRRLAERGIEGVQFTNLIIAAPDFDAGVFRDQIAPHLSAVVGNATLYASSNDLALKASREIHDYPLLGQGGASLAIVPGIHCIDASSVTTDLGLNHSYYANTVLDDVELILRQGLPPDERGLTKRQRGTETFWVFD